MDVRLQLIQELIPEMIRRCQWHKRENVVDYLPKGRKAHYRISTKKMGLIPIFPLTMSNHQRYEFCIQNLIFNSLLNSTSRNLYPPEAES